MRPSKYHYIFPLLLLLTFLSSCDLVIPDERVEKLDCGIYLKVVSWGLTGDNKRTYVGITPDFSDTVIEPYYRCLDFFYMVEDCKLIIIKADSLNRSHLLNRKILIEERNTKKINFSNYNSLGYENVLYY